MNKSTLILFTGNPSTGKTTSTQRLHQHLVDTFKVTLLTTLSVRESLNLTNDLHSNDARVKVYKEISNLLNQSMSNGSEIIILDGNFNKYERRKDIYIIAEQHNANIFVIECVVTRMAEIQKRLSYRQRNLQDIENLAASMDLYNLIKDDADTVSEDSKYGHKITHVIYNTEKQIIENNTKSNNLNIEHHEFICKAILPDNLTNTRNINLGENQRIKAIIFDIGGVIQSLRWEKVTKIISEIKPDISTDEFRNAFYFEKEKYFAKYETAQATAIEFWSMVAKQLNISLDKIEFLSKAFTELYSNIKPAMEDFILELKSKYRLFVLSNSCLELQRAIETYYDFYENFDYVYYSHRLGFKKPEVESFKYILKENQLKSEECIFIDDVTANINAAESVGIKGLLFVSLSDLKSKFSEL